MKYSGGIRAVRDMFRCKFDLLCTVISVVCVYCLVFTDPSEILSWKMTSMQSLKLDYFIIIYKYSIYLRTQYM